nr:uncharacterized protein LOC105495125 isoform X5 [Macaca nemestrina]
MDLMRRKQRSRRQRDEWGAVERPQMVSVGGTFRCVSEDISARGFFLCRRRPLDQFPPSFGLGPSRPDSAGLRVGAVFSPRRRESRGRKLARSGGACPPSPARLGGPRRWTRLGCSSSAGAAPDVPRLGPGIQPARWGWPGQRLPGGAHCSAGRFDFILCFSSQAGTV